MAETKAEQLKKCPFCGGEAVRGMFSVWCGKCLAGTCRDNTDATEKQIITAWNTRPLEDALAAALEAWMKVESEMADNHPCPDYTLRAQYRKNAVKLTEQVIEKYEVKK